MLGRKEFMKKAVQITEGRVGTRTAFWFDLDFVGFKLFNMHYGIDEGNKILAAMQSFLNEIPEVALCERVFSDEYVFLVLTEEPRSDEEMTEWGGRYIGLFIEKYQKSYMSYKMKISCGICPVFSGVPIESIDNASVARKQAKQEAPVAVFMFTQAMLDEMETRRKLEEEIACAMQEDRVIFDLQPQVELSTGRIFGAEALARLVSEEGTPVPPGVFMDVMEENGTVVDLDFLILEKVCAYLAERMKKNLPVVRTSVNLSRRHIFISDTARRIHDVISRYQIPVSLLEFELTETIFLEELDGAGALLDQLRSYGYTTSIDDFGSGYAGINLCQQIEFDTVKLDRKFLTDDEQVKSKNRVIVPCIVEMMQKLGIQTICEGVEREDQCRFLREARCRFVQGYYFSRPVAPESFYQTYMKYRGCYPVPK